MHRVERDSQPLFRSPVVYPSLFVILQVPRKKVSEIMRYVQNKKIEDLDVREGRWLTGIGIVCYVFGGLLLIMRVAIGSIVPQPLSRRDLSSKKRLFK